jgi:hypothetical protein
MPKGGPQLPHTHTRDRAVRFRLKKRINRVHEARARRAPQPPHDHVPAPVLPDAQIRGASVRAPGTGATTTATTATTRATDSAIRRPRRGSHEVQQLIVVYLQRGHAHDERAGAPPSRLLEHGAEHARHEAAVLVRARRPAHR